MNSEKVHRKIKKWKPSWYRYNFNSRTVKPYYLLEINDPKFPITVKKLRVEITELRMREREYVPEIICGPQIL